MLLRPLAPQNDLTAVHWGDQITFTNLQIILSEFDGLLSERNQNAKLCYIAMSMSVPSFYKNNYSGKSLQYSISGD